MSIRSNRRRRRCGAVALSACAGVAAMLSSAGVAHAQRLKGVDISDHHGVLDQTTWNNVKDAGRDFVFLRASRGGTTGFYDEHNSNNSNRNNTLGQRYDDLYFEQNVAGATAAGMW